MSDHAQLAAFSTALRLAENRSAPQPRIAGLEALGRSSHGGAPVTGGVITDVVELEKLSLGIVKEDITCSV